MGTEDDHDETEEASNPRPPRPKRGAFPTPQSQIEKAKVFAPPGQAAPERGSPQAAQSPADTDQKND